MFQGKVYVYENVDGKVKKIEKTFDNEHEYHSFMNNHHLNVSPLQHLSPLAGLNDFFSLHRNFRDYLDEMMGNRLALSYDESEDQVLPASSKSGLFNFDGYEQALADGANNKQKADHLRADISKLKHYEEQFKSQNNKKLLKQVQDDIAKAEQALRELD